MTLFLSYNIETNSERITTSSWSNTDIPVLAVATESCKISFYQDEALHIEEHDMQKDNIITAMSWHPSDMALTYGYLDGRVGIWVDEDSFTKEEKIHESRIVFIKFNHSGRRVVSVDEKGLVVVWSFEGALQRLCSYKQAFTIEEIMFPKFIYEKMDSSKVPPQEKLDTLFFFCNSGGVLHLADDSNSSPEICRVGGKIKSLLFYEKENAIIIITSHMLLVKCTIHFNQQLTPKKVKLSIAGNADNLRCTWAGEGLIAIVSGDDLVRFFYLETDQSYFVSMAAHELGRVQAEDSFTCIDFNYRKRILIVGSARGRVYMWKCNLTASIIPVSGDAWEPYCIVDTIPNITEVKWSQYMGLVHISNKNLQHAMLSETVLQKKMNEKIKVIQTSHRCLEIISNDSLGNAMMISNKTYNVKKVEMNETIKGLDLFNNLILTWNGSYAFLYECNLSNLSLSKLNTIQVKSNLLCLNEDSIISGSLKAIDIYSFEGELKNKINIDMQYGEISLFHSMNKFLLVSTTNNYFGIFDISRRTLKQIMMFRRFERNGELIGEIRDASINSKGNFICFICDTMANSDVRVPETKFYIFDVEMDSFTEHEISPNRVPIEILWDITDHRLFGIQTEYAKELNSEQNTEVPFNPSTDINEDESKKLWIGPEFYMFFFTTEYGILQQESHKINRDIQGVYALAIPSIYFIVSKTSSHSIYSNNSLNNCSLYEKKFQFFEGLEKLDDNIKSALIEFSIFMSSGKLDEAYKIVKNIKNPLIWENMSQICIKTKRLDVLEICLSNMRFSRGIKALRESKNEKEIEVRLAMVAMHLNMIEEAKILLQEVSRWDVLIHFYVDIGEYEKAVEVAKSHSRIDLENTYYRIAEHYERINDMEKAIESYKLSGCGAREIPRMLVQKNRIDLLEIYMGKGEDLQSQLWWAAYLESQGDLDNSMLYYKKAKDWSNLTRLLLSLNRSAEAKEICDDKKDPGASYLMGHFHEGQNDIRNAIYYYALSGRINQAFRLAKEHNLDAEIYNLGLKAPQHTQNLIAEYFEKKGIFDKSITLFLLAGNVKKALNLCLITQQYDKIREIADSIEYKNDKETLRALGEYFLEQKQHEKALTLYVKLKDYDFSMKLCENHKIKISLQTANAIVEEIENDSSNQNKLELTERMAKLLMMQGDFEAAHQIYVKLVNLKKALKCLIKMGNKDRVVEFSQTCRLPELFIMAANFLQSLDWVESEELVKTIVSFYTKAKAYLSLANFYEVFANVEINEFRNYEKAIILYQESVNAIEKSKDEDDKKLTKINILNNKIKVTKIFLQVMKALENDPDDALRMCNELLNIVKNHK